MATKPATAPVLIPTTVGFLPTNQSRIAHTKAAVAVARLVTKNALPARPSAASPLPALNPNHPNQSRAAPIATKGIL